MKKYSLSALVAAGLLAGGLSVTSANAADLGGNCCADLEERIAELEATTARKGNRKVSLTISGWVAEQVTWFEDEEESNVYVSGIGRTLQSHVKFSGQATIAPGWTAGYVLHLELGTVDPFQMNGSTDDPQPFAASLPGVVNDTETGVYTLQSYWFIKSDHLGKVAVGKQSQASDNTAILVDGSGSLVPANWVLFDGKAMSLGNGFVVGDLGFCHSIGDGIGGDCNGVTENVIRYDSPTFGGFSFSASWGEDDMWDVAARYAGEFGGFKLAVAGAYTNVTDENLAVDLASLGFWSKKDTDYFQIGGYAQHVATGLFIYGAYGHEEADYADFDPDDDGLGGEEIKDVETYYIKAGIRQRWTPLGHSVFYGEYMNVQDGLGGVTGLVAIDNADGDYSSELELWGLGVVQEIDAAAMSIWLSYKHIEGEVDLEGVSQDLGEVDLVKFGALINF